MDKRTELINILDNDPFGLLKVVTKPSINSLEDKALIDSFEEIQNFYEEFGKIPESNTSNLIEFKLFSRLKAIKNDPKKVKILKKYDFCGLLKGEEIKEIAIEDIIADDTDNIIGEDTDTDVFDLKHVKVGERIKPDYLARRKVCKEYSQYVDMFKSLSEELSNKKRRLVRYSSKDLTIGNFYVLNGVLLYLKSIEGDVNKYEYNSGERERFDGRTLCIFDNGTQSEMLFRSLDKAMQLDGYCISEKVDDTAMEPIYDTDISNGYIYVLKSLNPDVQSIQNLYKIGYTTGLVEYRIKNAKKEATYLFNGVEIVSVYRCFNILSYSLEQSIHDFFARVKLDIELLDNNGNSYKPKEWFKVDFRVIEDAIALIIKNKIGDYVYDPIIDQIILKNAPKEVGNV